MSYKVTTRDYVGNESPPATAGTTTSTGDAGPPARYALHQNIPNPFNPHTTVRYAIPMVGTVTLVVYDAAGHRVRSLLDTSMPAGDHEAVWNGRDDRGNGVASGVYFYRLRAGSFVQTRRMVLIR